MALGLLLGPAAAAGQQQQSASAPPTITKAHDAHSLTIEQAAQGYPVRLRAIVTYYDPYNDPRRPACFVADSSGGIYVDLSALPAIPFKAGDLVEITGISAAGGYAPIVGHGSAVDWEVPIPFDCPASDLERNTDRRI